MIHKPMHHLMPLNALKRESKSLMRLLNAAGATGRLTGQGAHLLPAEALAQQRLSRTD